MKTIFAIFLSLFLVKGCEAQNKSMKQTTIVYEAFTRGTFKSVIIENKKMYMVNEQGGKRNEVQVTDKEWKDLIEAYNEIDLEGMETLKAPTDNRKFDGAMHANVTISTNGKSYTTPGFDHQKPPKEIEKFINKLVSLTFVE